jgi:hypothetical protein
MDEERGGEDADTRGDGRTGGGRVTGREYWCAWGDSGDDGRVVSTVVATGQDVTFIADRSGSGVFGVRLAI